MAIGRQHAVCVLNGDLVAVDHVIRTSCNGSVCNGQHAAPLRRLQIDAGVERLLGRSIHADTRDVPVTEALQHSRVRVFQREDVLRLCRRFGCGVRGLTFLDGSRLRDLERDFVQGARLRLCRLHRSGPGASGAAAGSACVAKTVTTAAASTTARMVR